MATPIAMPKLGMTMSEGTVISNGRCPSASASRRARPSW